MPDGLLQRIGKEVGVDLVEALVGLDPTDLQSVLIEVHRQVAGRLDPPAVLRRYTDSRFVRPADLDPRELSALRLLAWSLLPEGYEPVELSPLCPLGTCSAIATVDQNKAVAGDRNVEVVSDSTNVLALEAALRRRVAARAAPRRDAIVRLATSQRHVRAQFYGNPQAAVHFELFATVTAGRALPKSSFECMAVVEQVAYFVSLIQRWRPGWTVNVAITDFAGRSRLLEECVRIPLLDQAPGTNVRIDAHRQGGRGYYVDLCYKVYVTTEEGEQFEVGDGGSTDWTRKLLSDRQGRLVIGGLGTDRLIA